MKAFQQVLAAIDRWQRRTRVVAPAYGVVKKFGDDRMNQYVVALGWYGFLAIYPLLLVVITVFGFIGAASLGHGIINTLHEFPVIGTQFNAEHGSLELHGSAFALVIGVLGLMYGAQGVTQTAQGAMAQAWNIPAVTTPGFLPRLVRSLIALLLIGGSFLMNAWATTFVAGSGDSVALRVPLLLAMVVLNVACFLASFRALTPAAVPLRSLLPGAVVGAVGFTVLITLGSGLVQHQLRHSSSTYGQFGAIIGLVGFLFLLAKISLYGAELNAVRGHRYWPRALVSSSPTEADHAVLAAIAHQQRRRLDQRIGVGFGEHAARDAGLDAQTHTDDPPSADVSPG
jgi:uncharacterized BrkB/YihY/UPF0761 family membrane protein